MPYLFTLNMVPLVFAAAISGALAIYTWRNRKTAGATPFSILLFILFEWGISYVLELAAVDLESKTLWAIIKFVGVAASPVAWLTFAFEYTGRKAWMNARRLAMLSIIPLTTMILLSTNESHRLFWTSRNLALEVVFIC